MVAVGNSVGITVAVAGIGVAVGNSVGTRVAVAVGASAVIRAAVSTNAASVPLA